MNQYFSADPYEGARRAYLHVNSAATDADWEDWINSCCGDDSASADYLAVIAVCKAALNKSDEIEPFVERHISYSAGVFEALQAMLTAQLEALHICAPCPKQS